MTPLRTLALAVATATMLGGCQPDATDRITELVPVASEVDGNYQVARGELDDPAAFDAEYAAKVKVRALECSRGRQFDWWADEAEVKLALAPARFCFEAADRELGHWVAWRRVGFRLGQPAARPVPATRVPLLAGDDAIVSAGFADDSAIAALRWKGHVRLVDTADGRVVRDFEAAGTGPVSVSPNGAVIAVGTGGTVTLFGADGRKLVEFVDVLGGDSAWLGDQLLAINSAGDGTLNVIDFEVGRATRLPELHDVHFVQRLEQRGRALLVGREGPAMFFDAPDGAANAPRVAVSGYGSMRPSFPRGASAITRAEKVYGLVPGGVFASQRTSTHDVVVHKLDGLPVEALQPTADPDVLLLTVRTGNGRATLAYSLSQRTLAQLDPAPTAGTRLAWVPALGRNIVYSGKAVLLPERVRTQAPQAVAAFVGGLPVPAKVEEVVADAAAPPPPAPVSQPRREPQDAPREGPYAIINGREVAIPNEPLSTSPPRARPIAPRNPRDKEPKGPSGQEQLIELVRDGTLRLGTQADLEAWKRKYEGTMRRGVGRDFDEKMGFATQFYVVQRDLTIPEDTTGGPIPVYIVPTHVPYPRGKVSHGIILDMRSGACVGFMCYSLNEGR
jgi:hypothetical protein